ncbi:hypothetical protein [Streptomyces beigongshangae]|uniref:hypothetical protein n=1 Tax=Streptomyces beigongshangae TaxID=2841597 RepID=UPI001C853DD7|nr:hypothetical protein [Streptomyces sp. REN17]
MGEIYGLGEITCPSGELVIVDGGHLGMWSGEGSPALVDPGSFGVQEPAVAADVAAATDFVITGPDAGTVAHSFGRQPGRTLHDVPASAVARLTELFDAHCREHGLDAGLEACAERVPHRERVRQCTERGGGCFLMHGVPVVALGGVPRDRPLPVLATDTGIVVPFAPSPFAPSPFAPSPFAPSPFTSRSFAPSDVGPSPVDLSSVDLSLTGIAPADVSDLAPSPATKSVELGEVRVDWARLLFGDADALGAWRHDEPVDGLADVAFWGAAEEAAAARFSAPDLGGPGEDGVKGWTGLPMPEAMRLAGALFDWKDAAPRRRLTVDFRPHSHHWQIMREVRASPLEAGTVEVGGARVLCTMTGRGDGRLPVSAELDPTGRPVAVRVSFPD